MAGKRLNMTRSSTPKNLVGSSTDNGSCCFQAKVGRKKEFQLALQTLRGKDTDVSREAAEIQVLTN